MNIFNSSFKQFFIPGANKAHPSVEGGGSRGSNNSTPSLPSFKFRKSDDNLEILDDDEFISTAGTKFGEIECRLCFWFVFVFGSL